MSQQIRIGCLLIFGPFLTHVVMQYLMLRYCTLPKVMTAVSREACGEQKYRLRLIRFVPPPQVGVAACRIGSSALALHTNRASWCVGVVRVA